jgi:hypothetical protein
MLLTAISQNPWTRGEYMRSMEKILKAAMSGPRYETLAKNIAG